MDVKITRSIIRALNSFKESNNIKSNYALSKKLGVAESTVGCWYNKPNTVIRAITWKRIGPQIDPFIDDSLEGNEGIAAILDEYEEEENLDYVIASLAERVHSLTEIVPIKLESLTGEKRKSLRKILEGIAELTN